MGGRGGHGRHVLAAAAIIAGGVGVGLVEALRLPRGSVWLVVVVTLVVVLVARARRR